MGGSLLKKFGARRLQKEEYSEVQDQLISQLAEISDLKFFTIPQCSDKDSHGDIDICVNSSIKDIRSLITSNFITNGTGQNDDIFSFVFRGEFQVDIMCSPVPEFTRNSLAYNDIISVAFGSICKMNGMKLKKSGLYYINPMTNNDILVTSRWSDVLDLFGLEQEIEDESKVGLFQFVCSTPFFNRDAFIEHQEIPRKVNRRSKRPIQDEFIKYVRCSQYAGELLPTSVLHHKILSIDGFQERLKKDNQIQQDNAIMNHMLKTKFNSRMIMDLTGLQGKELGEFIRRFKNDKGGNFQQWVKLTTEEEIIQSIIVFKQEVIS